MSSTSSDRFKEADALFAIPKVPESSSKDQIVHVGPHVLNTKKESRKVVPEEKYVSDMKTLIQRDYFPDLKKLKVQNEYIEAIIKGDDSKIRELQVKYAIKKPITATPALSDFDTPSTSYTPDISSRFPYSNAEGDNDKVFIPKKKSTYLDKFTLQSYLNTFTSEDNASFEELAALMNERERQRNSWMYEAEKKHNEEFANQLQPIKAADEQLLAIQSGQIEKPNNLDGWSYKARNALIFNPGDEAPLTKEEFIARLKQNDYEINKKATRLDKDEAVHTKPVTMAKAALHQAANHIGKVDVTGKDLGVVDAEILGCVATPVFQPGVEDTPLMTWGEIDGTPFRLDGNDDPIAANDAPVFKMPEIPLRDKIRDSISETIGKRFTNKRKYALETTAKAHEKTPKFGSTRANLALGLSPAAKQLMVNKLGIKIKSSNNFGNRTPSASNTPDSVRSTSSRFGGATPSIRDMIRTSSNQSSLKRISQTPIEYPPTPEHASTKVVAKKAVADLLNLQPNIEGLKRPRAADFD